jgi:peptidoglycan hydrolase-like protein with peptidoglycan-binding domain
MRRASVWLAAAVMLVAHVTASSGASTTWTHGYDISWPQCSGSSAQHLPGGHPRYVVLGLTHGAGHTANPCLADQLSWARSRGSRVAAYLVPSYPTKAQRTAAKVGVYGACSGSLRCRLRNDGAAQAADALLVMRRAGLDLPMVWVDVEFRSNPAWTRYDGRNRAVLQGVFRGLRDAGLRYGVYTTSYMWSRITGGWRVDVPNWLPSGNGRATTARHMCRTSGTGGTTWLVQYTREWDENLTCPSMDARPGVPGALWPYRHQRLSTGSSGAAVEALQRALTAPVTGTYDVPTAAVVSQFQVQRGLPVTGSVDSDDWRALGAFTRVGGRPFRLLEMTTR